MSFSVNTNAGALAALGNLNRTTASLEITQSRINTGLKVASAKDNAATYAIAQTLRSDVAGYRAVGNSLDRASSELDVAIAGAEAISDLLIQMKEKAVAAKDDGLDDESRTSLNDDYQQLLSQVTSISENASFNGRNLLTGDSVSAITDAIGDSTITASVTNLTTASLGLDATALTAGGSESNVLVSVGDTFNSGDALEAMNNYMEAHHPAIYSNPAVYDQADGSVEPAAWSTVGSAFDAEFPGATIAINLHGPLGANLSSLGGGTLYINGTGSSAEFTTEATTNTGGPDEAVDAAEAAISTVNTVLSDLGSTANRVELQQQFAGSLSDSIEVGIGNLVDADLARESANLQALQTKQQLGLQALSIANQSPQSVLSLFR